MTLYEDDCLETFFWFGAGLGLGFRATLTPWFLLQASACTIDSGLVVGTKMQIVLEIGCLTMFAGIALRKMHFVLRSHFTARSVGLDVLALGVVFAVCIVHIRLKLRQFEVESLTEIAEPSLMGMG